MSGPHPEWDRGKATVHKDIEDSMGYCRWIDTFRILPHKTKQQSGKECQEKKQRYIKCCTIRQTANNTYLVQGVSHGSKDNGKDPSRGPDMSLYKSPENQFFSDTHQWCQQGYCGECLRKKRHLAEIPANNRQHCTDQQRTDNKEIYRFWRRTDKRRGLG